MGDAMVTARMPQAKKDAGNEALRRLGSSASQFINSAYDYLIQHGRSPFDADEASESELSPQSVAQALAQIDDMCLPASNRFAAMTDDEIRRERLAHHGLEVG